MTLIPDGARFQGSQMRNQQEAIENAAAITLLQIVRLKTCTFIIQVAYWVYFCITSSVEIQINNYMVHVYDIVHLHVQFIKSISLWSERLTLYMHLVLVCMYAY